MFSRSNEVIEIFGQFIQNQEKNPVQKILAKIGLHPSYITKKTERENRKAELGPVHKRIIEFISRYLMECEESVVEDFLLDSEKQLKLVNSFIQKGLLLSSAVRELWQ